MPQNLFGKLKPNQLMEMLQQEQAQQPMNRAKMTRDEALLSPQASPQAAPQPSRSGFSDFYADGLPTGPGGPTVAAEKPPLPTQEQAGSLLWRAGTVGLSPLGAAGLVTKKLYDMASEQAPTKTVNAPPAVPTASPEVPPPSGSRAVLSDREVAEGLSTVSQLEDEAIEGQQNRLRAEYESTPELDQLIADAQGKLAKVKSERKQPGLGEFLTLALMNLGNRDHRNNADMILGTSQYEKDAGGLETLINNLEGSRAGAKMAGRRNLQAMQQKDRYSALERMLQTQEMLRKQQNEERDFGFKNQKMGADKLMQRIGQLTNQMGTETDPNKRDALRKEIERLDPYFPKKQQQQQPPPDNRQSRMFGELLGGGGYA